MHGLHSLTFKLSKDPPSLLESVNHYTHIKKEVKRKQDPLLFLPVSLSHSCRQKRKLKRINQGQQTRLHDIVAHPHSAPGLCAV